MDLLLNFLLLATVYAIAGGLLVGISMPLWLPVLKGLLELFTQICELYARYEEWRDRRHANPR